MKTTKLYAYARNLREYAFIDFLNSIHNKDELFAKVRKRVAKVTSDYVIGRYQALTEMRYQELGGVL